MKADVSALLDGELDDTEAIAVLDALKKDAGLRGDWAAYVAAGDVLRGSAGRGDITARVMAQLESEPTVLAPVARSQVSRPWSRYLMPLAASVMGVAAVGWVAQSLNTPPEATTVVRIQVPAAPAAVASAPQAATQGQAPGPVPVKHYFFAHHGFVQGGDIQAVAYGPSAEAGEGGR